jgi:hypothetical protein
MESIYIHVNVTLVVRLQNLQVSSSPMSLFRPIATIVETLLHHYSFFCSHLILYCITQRRLLIFAIAVLINIHHKAKIFQVKSIDIDKVQTLILFLRNAITF